MTDTRVRLSQLAGTLGVDFPELFSLVCRLLPQAIDDDLTVSRNFASELRWHATRGRTRVAA